MRITYFVIARIVKSVVLVSSVVDFKDSGSFYSTI